MHEYALVLLVTAAVTYLLTPLVRRVAIVTHTMHEPRARDVHTRPTPLLGGLAMYGGLIAGLILAGRLTSLQDPFASAGSRTAAGLLLAGGLLVVVGFIDDRWGLSAVSKLAGQVAAGGILVWSGQSLPWVPMPSGGVFSLEPDLSVTLTILLVVVTINAINFIDGLDGLAAGIVAVAALSFLAYSYTLIQTIGSTSQSLPAVSSALLAGMCLGFLPHNFYPARIFMGDIGSSLLGLLLAYLPISSTASLDPALLTNYAQPHTLDRYPTFLPLLVPAAIFVIPYADLMFAIIRRTRAGKPLMAADRQHLHHRVLNIGHSYRQSVLIMYLWAALFSAAVVSLSVVRTRLVVLEAATVIAVLTLLPVTMPRLRPWRLARSRAAVPAAASGAVAASSRTAGGRPAGQAFNGTPPSASPFQRAPFPDPAPFPDAARFADAPALPAAAPLPGPAQLPGAAPLPGDQLPRAGRLPGTEPAGSFAPGYPVAPVNPFPGPHEQPANGHLAYPDPVPAPDPFPGPGPATADGPPDGPDPRSRAKHRDMRPR
jgi:UDP-GlcNAc:undecaprenyl-phosphate/decaprenyl-phosphate GlcNAc-1-phosphate transferase